MRSRPRALILLVAAAWALLLLPILHGAAWAQTGHPLLDRGIELYNDLEYAQATAVLEQAVADPALTAEQRAEGYKHLALSYLALGRDDDARAAFRSLLEAAPDYRLPRTESPKALDIFGEVLASMPKTVVDEPVRLSQTAAPPRPKAGSAVSVTVALVDPAQRITGVQIRHRTRGGKRFSTVTAQAAGAGRYNATIPGAFVLRPALEYYVVAVNEAGEVVASGASEREPVVLMVDEPVKGSPPIYGRWWFWGAVGGLALASIAVGVALGGGTEDDPFATIIVTAE